ncbi:MAG: hypothetical protein HWN80_14290 [Candidatus Lokiarchaeota archaeon]|nr:hypothetical protein [Candidatus Lokiarchaeota archaeon]
MVVQDLKMTPLQGIPSERGTLLTDGVALNVRINPSLIETDEGIDKMTSLLEAYFELG